MEAVGLGTVVILYSAYYLLVNNLIQSLIVCACIHMYYIETVSANVQICWISLGKGHGRIVYRLIQFPSTYSFIHVGCLVINTCTCTIFYTYIHVIYASDIHCNR